MSTAPRSRWKSLAYVGPAPVSLAAYTAGIQQQAHAFPAVTSNDVSEVLADLVLEDDSVEVAGLAASSGRSVFVYGPSGNGKTTLGRLLHNLLRGSMWIPHAIAVGTDVIRMFDSLCHEVVEVPDEHQNQIDQRWVRIRRPLVIVGGELSLESLELAYLPNSGFYDAPLHVKSNGGLLLLDDFGRQRVAARDLLNRWIVPLEHQVDFLNMRTGQQIQVPFRQLLVIATNLNPTEVTDPAFLRRMGYRLELDTPTPERYRRIFEYHARKNGMEVPPGLVDLLLQRYEKEGATLRGCEPLDLLARVGDICRYNNKPVELNTEVLDRAWTSYFGTWSVGGTGA